MPSHFTSVKFKNYKSFKNFSVALNEFNILVGPNNAGKSTVIGAFRILAEGMRRAQAKSAEYSDSPSIRGHCYPVNLRELPVSTENVFTDYDDSEPAVVEFRISNGNRLRLIFPERDSCYLVCEVDGRPVRTPSDFRRAFDVAISFVPVLGPVEHDEGFNLKETARRALLTHRASRNFRNIWYHFPEGFDEFRRAVQETWPGMDIGKPEVSQDGGSRTLHMFCPEERIPRELFWAGFGFQVWCQMLTFITKAETGAFLIIDEPDIYLHSDLQRQLLHLLRARQGDVLIATHSTEILAEAESGEILVLNRRWRSAKRIQRPAQLQSLFGELGSNLNPILTQLAKTKKVLFVEGDDFRLISSFARKMGMNVLANGASFAVVPAHGFNPARVKDFSDGMEATLGVKISRAVVFDRDYRSENIVSELKQEFMCHCEFAHIHERKEIENFVLVPAALERAIRSRMSDRKARGITVPEFRLDIVALLTELTDSIKSDVFGQYNAAGISAIKEAKSGTNIATTSTQVYADFERNWRSLDSRLLFVPGKLLLSKINERLQPEYSVTITAKSVIDVMLQSEVPPEMRNLIESLSKFSKSAR